jgi:Predicted acyl esterases
MNLVFSDWPIPRTEYRKLYLSGQGFLEQKISSHETTLSYQADAPAFQRATDTEELSFAYTFERKSYVVGHAKAVLYMSCHESDDMDVFVQLRKLDEAAGFTEF